MTAGHSIQEKGQEILRVMRVARSTLSPTDTEQKPTRVMTEMARIQPRNSEGKAKSCSPSAVTYEREAACRLLCNSAVDCAVDRYEFNWIFGTVIL
jgi:hypothetical protein